MFARADFGYSAGMILDTLSSAARYTALHPGFARALSFLRRRGRTGLAPGRYELGDGLYAVAARDRGRGTAILEAHRKFIDIQYVVSGTESIGWQALAACRASGKGYDRARDIEFFRDPPAAMVRVPAGAFAIFFPGDAHAPLAGRGTVSKIVVKVPVQFRPDR